MNTFNRVLVIVLLLLAIIVCSALLVIPSVLGNAVTQLSALDRWQDGLNNTARIALGVIFALVLSAIFVLLIVLEVRGPLAKSIKVDRAAGGEVNVSVATITDRIHHEVDQMPGILNVKPKVSARRGGVVLDLDVRAAAPMDLPQVAQQIVEMSRQVVEKDLGLRLAQPPKVTLLTEAASRKPEPAPEPPPAMQEPAFEPEAPEQLPASLPEAPLVQQAASVVAEAAPCPPEELSEAVETAAEAGLDAVETSDSEPAA